MSTIFTFTCSSNAFTTNQCMNLPLILLLVSQIYCKKTFPLYFRSFRFGLFLQRHKSIIHTILSNLIQIISTQVFSIHNLLLKPTENQTTCTNIYHITIHLILILSNEKRYSITLVYPYLIN
jgi:hypothetical protein